MTLDHYVSQTHLRNFYSADTKRLFAIRKSDLKEFPPRSEDVCRIDEGNTNPYLADARAVEKFLLDVEPYYNAVVVKIRDDRLDHQCVYVAAGFAAYVMSCSPTAMRLLAAPTKMLLRTTATLLDRKGKFGKPPDVLGGKSITELLDKGSIDFSINEKYPQAIGVSSIIDRVSVMGNSPWTIFINNSDRPFFTSDYPIAVEALSPLLVAHIVPLAPDLAIRIVPDMSLARQKPDLAVPKFGYHRTKLSREKVDQVNDLIVKSAEDLIFSSVADRWVARFVRARRGYRVESTTQRIPFNKGYYLVTQQRLGRRKSLPETEAGKRRRSKLK